MRYARKFGLAISVLCTAAIVTAAAAPGAAREEAAAPGSGDASVNRLLSAEEGEALVDLAVESAADLRSQPDCSHLVHLVYARAGLNYPYQHSRALYGGVPDFQRVKSPQPGDLIVWPGHVGIVVSPDDNTFFSSVRSGIITESWTADYWRARGLRRFFRYRLGPETDLALLASLTRDESHVPSEHQSDNSINAKIEASSQTGVQGESEDDSNDVVGRVATPNRTVASARPAADGRSSAPRTSAQAPPRSASASSQPEAGAVNSGKDPSLVVAVIHQRGKPGKQAIAAAFMAASDAAARRLITAQVPAAGVDLERPLSVVARVQVVKIKISHSTGTVTLKLNEVMSLQQGTVLPARTTQRELSMHRRSVGGSAAWVISDPHRRIYLPQSQALNVFESQAELLLHHAPDSRATRMVVKALDILYDQQPDTPQRAALK